MGLLLILLGAIGLVLVMVGYIWLLGEAIAIHPVWILGVLCVPFVSGVILIALYPRARLPCAVFLMGFGTVAIAVVAGSLVRTAALG